MIVRDFFFASTPFALAKKKNCAYHSCEGGRVIDDNVIDRVEAFKIAHFADNKFAEKVDSWTVRQLLDFLFLNTESATAFIMPWANAKFGVTIPPPYDDESIANAERDTLRKLRSAGKKIYHRR